MNNLANLFTCLNLLCGFASIIFSLENRVILAAWAIIVSVILDGIDGWLARGNSVANELGKELDSMADLVAFGVAPAVLGYVFISEGAYFVTTFVLFIYLTCSMFRLAKYNITPKGKLADYFYGLPITLSGGIIAAVVLVHLKHIFIPVKGIFLSLILVLSFLMASNIKYLNLSGLKRIIGEKKSIYFIITMLIGLIIVPEVIIFLLFAFYLTATPTFSKKALSHKNT